MFDFDASDFVAWFRAVGLKYKRVETLFESVGLPGLPNAE